MRSGMIAQKVGMTRVFGEDGSHIPVTVLKVDTCQVVAKKNQQNRWLQCYPGWSGACKGKASIKTDAGTFCQSGS